MARHRFSSPRLHTSQVPQPIHGSASRTLPILTPLASGPTATTLPTFSWPSVTGSFMPRSSRLIFLPPPRSNQPSARCKSLWHTPAASTLSRISLPLGSGVGPSLHCKGWPQTQTWNIRMDAPPALFNGGQVSTDRFSPPERGTGRRIVARRETRVRAVERGQHAPFDRIERRRLPAARPRQMFGGNLVADAARPR